MFTPARSATARVRKPSNPACATTSKAAWRRVSRRLPCSSCGSRISEAQLGEEASIDLIVFHQLIDCQSYDWTHQPAIKLKCLVRRPRPAISRLEGSSGAFTHAFQLFTVTQHS